MAARTGPRDLPRVSDRCPLRREYICLTELTSSICGDGTLLQNIYRQFDSAPSSLKLFAKVVSALGRLLNEKPVLLGACAQINGLDVHSHLGGTGSSEALAGSGAGALAAGHGGHGGYLDMGLGMMASAANAGINTVGSMIGGPGGGLGAHSGMKLRL